MEGITPSDGHGTFGELGRGMRAMTETVHRPIELHLFSDMQQTSMPPNFRDLTLGPDAKLQIHTVGANSTPNWTCAPASESPSGRPLTT